MSESGSLATSSTGSDPDPFSQLLASMARPIPNSITVSSATEGYPLCKNDYYKEASYVHALGRIHMGE
uniref:Uncharacterized protein n=1 Tax=Parascaris equorum TaxID=6256 RepID=A0A914RCP6_PAREQ